METLTQENFTRLTKTEKVSQLFNEGEELMERYDSDYRICLYTLSGFFVEVWYRNPISKIESIEVVCQEKVVELYDNEIDLTKLF